MFIKIRINILTLYDYLRVNSYYAIYFVDFFVYDVYVIQFVFTKIS